MSRPRLLALDFDGVVSDSAPEAFVVALRTCRALDVALPATARALAEQEAPSLEQVEACPAYAPFVAAMPLGNRAEDFGVALGALAEGVSLAQQADYDACLERRSEAWRQRFHERFYRERERFRERDPKAWLALMAPYPAFLEILRRRAGEVELAIATAKDVGSVHALLDAYGVLSLFAEGRVVDKRAGRSKVAHLTILSERSGCSFGDILFVDDKVNHLDAVAELGARCALACWGYNGRREEVQARARGHRVLHLADAERQIFD